MKYELWVILSPLVSTDHPGQPKGTTLDFIESKNFDNKVTGYNHGKMKIPSYGWVNLLNGLRRAAESDAIVLSLTQT